MLTAGLILSLSSFMTPEPLSNQDIIDWLSDQEPTTSHSDPFSVAAPPSTDGKPFELTFDFAPQSQRYASFQWRYDLQRKTLTISVAPDSFYGRAWDSNPTNQTAQHRNTKGFLLKRTRSSEEGGRRSNAYGVEVDVETVRTEEIGIVEWSRDHRPPHPFSSEIIPRVTLRLEPEVARDLTSDIHIVARGVLKAAPNGSAIICGSDYVAPTIDNPREQIVRTCVAAADFQSITVERKSNGEPVARWPRLTR